MAQLTQPMTIGQELRVEGEGRHEERAGLKVIRRTRRLRYRAGAGLFPGGCGKPCR